MAPHHEITDITIFGDPLTDNEVAYLRLMIDKDKKKTLKRIEKRKKKMVKED